MNGTLSVISSVQPVSGILGQFRREGAQPRARHCLKSYFIFATANTWKDKDSGH